ncbi:unnamed protein product [Camellia sinensis]
MEMEHFSHHNPLIPCNFEGNWNWCPVCTQQILDPVYGYSKSRFTIHKPCVELPREIQHPFYPQHPLTLIKKLPNGSSSFDCCACSVRILGFAYQCIHCQTFSLDISCASLMPATTDNDSDDAAQRLLFTCKLLLNDSIYVCLICKLLLHKSCAELPKKIKHPFHQIHPLTLRTKDDGSPLSCKACLMPCGRLIYHCSKCEHSLHIKYASPVRIVRSKIHHHSLAFVDFPYPRGSNPIGSFNHPDSNCRDCGGNFMTPEFCEDNFPMPKVYRCVDCNFNIHLKCIPTLPETVQNGHRHRLTITDSMVKDRPDEDEEDPTIVYYCDACEQRRRLVDRTYYCTECHFVSHVDCDSVASEVVKSLETESFLAKENTVTKKWTSKAGVAWSDGCMHPIDSPIFVYLQCHFMLHKSCAKLPHEIRHPFHPQHSLMLVERFHHLKSCNACRRIFNGFIYWCGECKFKLDTKCALLLPNVKFKLHQHPLVFLTAYRCDCVKCGCKE